MRVRRLSGAVVRQQLFRRAYPIHAPSSQGRGLRPVVFPLFTIENGACSCGNETCTRVGKHPRISWGDLELGDEVPRPEDGAGVGLKTGAGPRGSDIIVVDLDSDAAVQAWEALGGSGPTMTVATPRGAHLYFAHPGFPVKNSASDLGAGIDVRGDGGFVVAPGSPHRSGGKYELVDDTEPQPAPPWLLAWLKERPAPAETQTYAGDVDGPERERRRGIYAAWLRDEAPARGPERRGQGDQTLFDVVQRGAYDLALPVQDVLDLVREFYDPRCSPMWGDELEERVLHKANWAKTLSSRPAMPPLPEDLAELFAPMANAATEISELVEEQKAERVSAETASPAKTETVSGPVVWGGWDKPIDPPVYLVQGLIPENKVVTFFAEGGSLKSWAAFSLAIAVATGRPWLATFPVQQGRSVLIDYEDGPYEYKRRIRLLQGQGLTDIPELGYYDRPPPLDQPELWKALLPLGLKLIVVDALSSGVSAEVDENDRQFSNAVKIAGRFTDVGCTVIFVHHANKQGGMRGSSTVRDQSDVVFKFNPVSETDSTKRMQMVCDKPGPQKRPLPVNVELSDDGLKTFVDEAKTLGRNARTIDDVKAAVLLSLSGGAKTVTELRTNVGGDNKKVDEAVRQLEQRAEIFSRGSHRGWEIDDREKMLARLRAEADTATSSKADFARRAFVQPDILQELIDEGLVLERVKGKAMGFIVP